MTTHVEVVCNGAYVATVKVNGVDAGSVGPGSMARKSFSYNHGQGATTYEVTERPATAEEVAAELAARVVSKT